MVKCLPNTCKVLALQPFKHTHKCMCECAQVPTPTIPQNDLVSLPIGLVSQWEAPPPSLLFPLCLSAPSPFLALPHPLCPLFFVFRHYPTILHSYEKCGHHFVGAANTLMLTL